MKGFRKILLGMAVVVLAGNMTFAADVPKESTETTTVSASEEALLVADYEEQLTKLAEEVLERGVPLRQAVTVNNVTLTLVSLYSDAYNYHMVVTLEKADHTAFKGIEQVGLRDLAFNKKEEIAKRYGEKGETTKGATSTAPAMSLEEMVKKGAEKDEKLRQFINEDGSIDKEGLEAYYKELNTALSSNSGGYSSMYTICKMEDSSDKKIYFLVSGSTMEPIPDVMQLFADHLENRKEVKYELVTDLIDYLKAHQGEKVATQPNEEIRTTEEWLAKIKEEDPELYKERMKQITSMPKTILINNDLNLKLFEGNKNVEIDNISFVDGKLHILLTNYSEQGTGTYQLCILDAAGNKLEPSSARGSSGTDAHGKEVIEEYSIFDIPNVEELSKCKLSVTGMETEIIAEGPWMMDVKIQPNKEKITKTCNEAIIYGTNQQAVIKRLELTPLSLVMNVENENKISNSNYIGAITLNMKDGSKVVLEHNTADKREGKNHLLVYRAGNTFIDTKEVISITIKNKTILL